MINCLNKNTINNTGEWGGVDENISLRITSLRFLLAVCVVIIHNCITTDTVSNYASMGKVLVFNQGTFGKWFQLFFSQGLCRCAVPLFFMFSAYLQTKKADTYGLILKKRLRSLALPYLLWFCIYLTYPHLIKLFLSFVHPSILNHPEDTILNWHISDWFHYIIGYGELDAHGDIGLPGFAIQFWFVRDLLILIIMSPVLKFCVRRFPFGYFFLIAFALFCPVKHLYIIRTQSLFFYSLGLYWAMYDIPLLEKIDGISWLEAFVIFLVSFAVTWLFYSKLETSYWFMNVAAGIILLKLSKSFVLHERIFTIAKKLAPYSFFLYAIHIFLLNIIQPLWIKAFPMKNDFFCFFEYFGVSISIIFIGLGIGIVLRKLIPQLFALLNGGRK